LADRVLLKIVYLIIRRILGSAVLVSRTDRAKDAELLVLPRILPLNTHYLRGLGVIQSAVSLDLAP
jgi:hypothetical protein